MGTALTTTLADRLVALFREYGITDRIIRAEISADEADLAVLVRDQDGDYLIRDGDPVTQRVTVPMKAVAGNYMPARIAPEPPVGNRIDLGWGEMTWETTSSVYCGYCDWTSEGPFDHGVDLILRGLDHAESVHGYEGDE